MGDERTLIEEPSRLKSFTVSFSSANCIFYYSFVITPWDGFTLNRLWPGLLLIRIVPG